jgi:hypothetical protein
MVSSQSDVAVNMEIIDRATRPRKLITAYPTLFGALLGVLLLVIIFSIVIWFPRVEEGWERHNSTIRDIWCTLALIIVTVNRFWALRRRIVFWTSLSIFFLFHSIGIFLYTKQVHPVLLNEWIFLALVESAILFFVLPWVTRRFRHFGDSH